MGSRVTSKIECRVMQIIQSKTFVPIIVLFLLFINLWKINCANRDCNRPPWAEREPSGVSKSTQGLRLKNPNTLDQF